jgi:hypothetical protein
MIREALNTYAASLGRRFKHDRSKTVGSSEIASCARRVSWRKHGIAPDPGFSEHPAARGTVMENAFWYPAMRKAYGNHLKIAGPNQMTFSDVCLSATPDGLITNLPRNALKHLGVKDIGAGRCVLVENKTIDPRVNITEAKNANVMQVQVALGVIRRRTYYRPNYAVISYIDASFWHEVSEFVVRFNPAILAKAEQRAVRILTNAGEELKPEGWIAGGKECEHCEFLHRCSGTRAGVPLKQEPIDPQFQAEVTDMCRDLLDLRQRSEQAEVSVREQEQALKDRLREKKVRKVPGVVTWSAVKGRIAYDNAAIREAAMKKGLDVEKFSTVGEPTDRLFVRLAIAKPNGGTAK